jgi:hypothetical protein
VPIGTSGANCYFKCRLLLQMPIVTLNADCYFEYQSSNDPPTRRRRTTTNWLLEPR